MYLLRKSFVRRASSRHENSCHHKSIFSVCLIFLSLEGKFGILQSNIIIVTLLVSSKLRFVTLRCRCCVLVDWAGHLKNVLIVWLHIFIRDRSFTMAGGRGTFRKFWFNTLTPPLALIALIARTPFLLFFLSEKNCDLPPSSCPWKIAIPPKIMGRYDQMFNSISQKLTSIFQPPLTQTIFKVKLQHPLVPIFQHQTPNPLISPCSFLLEMINDLKNVLIISKWLKS